MNDDSFLTVSGGMTLGCTTLARTYIELVLKLVDNIE
jgi:hypothetical protein